MNWRGRWPVVLWAVVALSTLRAQVQVGKTRPPASSAIKESPVSNESSVNNEFSVKVERVERVASDADAAVREIDDPATGDRWILLRDAAHPDGPGRMALISLRRTESRFESARGAEAGSAFPSLPAFVIHGGDRVIVEEHTRVADAELEAVALGPAAQGNPFRVRLKIGGNVILAVATTPGHAVVAAPIGAPQ
jgi:hypothetical protein